MARLKAKLIENGVENVLNENGMESSKEVSIFISNKSKEKDVFIKFFQAQGAILNNCKPATVKLFNYFLIQSAYGNYVEADIKSISAITDMSERSVKRGLQELVDNGVIVRDKDLNDKRRNMYLINPHIAWKGNPSDRKKIIRNKEINEPINQLKLNV